MSYIFLTENADLVGVDDQEREYWQLGGKYFRVAFNGADYSEMSIDRIDKRIVNRYID